jgi:hypothetical protein
MLEEFLRGRKTYLWAAGMFTLALAAIANGWGDAQIAALGGEIAVLAATLRAGIGKMGGGS